MEALAVCDTTLVVRWTLGDEAYCSRRAGGGSAVDIWLFAGREESARMAGREGPATARRNTAGVHRRVQLTVHC